MKFSITCAVCQRAVGRYKAEYLPDAKQWMITAYCHGAADVCMVGYDFATLAAKEGFVEGVAFKTPEPAEISGQPHELTVTVHQIAR